jgi:hypothetical protein
MLTACANLDVAGGEKKKKKRLERQKSYQINFSYPRTSR